MRTEPWLRFLRLLGLAVLGSHMPMDCGLWLECSRAAAAIQPVTNARDLARSNGFAKTLVKELGGIFQERRKTRQNPLDSFFGEASKICFILEEQHELCDQSNLRTRKLYSVSLDFFLSVLYSFFVPVFLAFFLSFVMVVCPSVFMSFLHY
jgi:hypothetical protein